MNSSVAGRILIVDDEPTNIEVLVELLEDQYDLLVSTDGNQALDLAVATPAPDLILLDVVMPELDGYEVCTRLKADHRTQDIPVIFITGLGDPADESKGLEAGAVDYITKPFNSAVVCRRVAVHLELKLARDRLARLATTDGLTGIPNRRQFDTILEVESRRLHRAMGARLSLIFIDIDHFKDFNDTYGHVAGDECLRRIARLLDSLVRRGPDMVARYGGEEFACILPETDRDGALALAERIRKEIEALRIPHVASMAAPHVTASFGVATVTPETQGFIANIVERADKQLYRAKIAGRNRVMVADVEDCSGGAIGIPGIDMGAGVARVRGNTRLYYALLRSFFDRNRTLAREFQSLLAVGDFERIRFLAHNIKGVAANLGAGDLARAAGTLEEAVAPPTIPTVTETNSMLLRFESRLADVLGGIDHFFAAGHADGEPAMEAAAANNLGHIRAVLDEALERLDHDLGVSLDLLTGIESRLRASALKESFAALQYHLAEFDTDNARATLHGMVQALAREAAPDTLPGLPAVNPDRPRLLVVDDAPENLLILVEALKEQYAISATRSGAQALMLATAEPPPALILMNIVLPDIDGYEICRRLKEKDATRHIPVIFLTGLESVENEALGLTLGAADYIRKPITYPVLDLRVKLHLALVESRQQLEQRTQEFQQAAQQREEIDRIIRHDLMTPLNTIVGTARDVLDHGSLPADLTEMIGFIRSAGEDMLRLISTTTEILRMEASVPLLDPTRSNLADIVKGAMADLATLASAKGVRVGLQLDAPAGGVDQAPMIAVERALIRSLFVNLIKNAIEASPSGEDVTITITDHSDEVWAEIRNKGAIPAAIRPRFFEKYATHGKPGGTGLGAYSARLIARAHGGDITFDTSEQVGTIMSVSLPKVPDVRASVPGGAASGRMEP